MLILYAGDLNSVLCSLKMKKFNIRKVLDGLKEVSSSTPSVQVGPQENHLIQETLQSEHFQLCKVGESDDLNISIAHAVLSPSFTVGAGHIPSQDRAGSSELFTVHRPMGEALLSSSQF